MTSCFHEVKRKGEYFIIKNFYFIFSFIILNDKNVSLILKNYDIM